MRRQGVKRYSKKTANSSGIYQSPNPDYQYPDPPPCPPLVPHYTMPFTHLMDPPYSTMSSPPMWWWLQPADGDLTALSNLTGTNTIYYRSGIDTWSPVTIGDNITFANGVLTAAVPAGASSNVVLTDGSGNIRYDYNYTNPGAHTMQDGGLYVQGSVRTEAVTVAQLPAPGHMGARNFVTDATMTLSAGMGNIVAGGGTHSVPVYDDGANWRIGG